MLYKKIFFLNFIVFQIQNCSPLAVNCGGTGQTTLTAYRVLCAGNPSTGPLAVVASTPNNFSILRSNGIGIPVFVNINTFMMTFITTLTASASSSLIFTSSNIVSNFSHYLIIFNTIVPSGAAVLNMDWSGDNGSSYFSSGYSSGLNYHAYNSTTFTNVNSTTTNPLSVSSAAAFSGFIFFDQSSKIYSGQGMYNTTGQFLELFGGYFGGGSNINNIKFSLSSGTITSGTITLYGMV